MSYLTSGSNTEAADCMVDPPEHPICEGCPKEAKMLQDNLPVCEECLGKEFDDMRRLKDEIVMIFAKAMQARSYTEQDGSHWHGFQSADTVRELIQNALGYVNECPTCGDAKRPESVNPEGLAKWQGVLAHEAKAHQKAEEWSKREAKLAGVKE